jgi:hypothetical protein
MNVQFIEVCVLKMQKSEVNESVHKKLVSKRGIFMCKETVIFAYNANFEEDSVRE